MEIVFANDGWLALLVAAPTVFIIIAGIAYAIGNDSLNMELEFYRSTRYARPPRSKKSWRKRFARRWLIGLLALYLIANAITASVSSAEPDKDASVLDLADHFGLKNGEEYPLILGDDQGSGIIGEATTSAGLFTASSAIDLRPTTTVLVGFQKDERWWQLTLPTSTTTFVKGSGSSAVSIRLNDGSLNRTDGPSDEQPVYWDLKWNECKWQLRNLWVVCNKEVTSRTLVVSEQLEREGLANLVSKYFQSAEIKLTNDQHAKLFPTN